MTICRVVRLDMLITGRVVDGRMPACAGTGLYLRCAPTELGLRPISALSGNDPCRKKERGQGPGRGGLDGVGRVGEGGSRTLMPASRHPIAAAKGRGDGGGVLPVCPGAGVGRCGGHAGLGEKLQQEASEREGRRVPPSVVMALRLSRPGPTTPASTRRHISSFGYRSRRGGGDHPCRARGAGTAAKQRGTLRGVGSKWFESDVRQRNET